MTVAAAGGRRAKDKAWKAGTGIPHREARFSDGP